MDRSGMTGLAGAVTPGKDGGQSEGEGGYLIDREASGEPWW